MKNSVIGICALALAMVVPAAAQDASQATSQTGTAPATAKSGTAKASASRAANPHPKSPAHKSRAAAAASTAPAKPAGPPIATFDTSVGPLTCTLFPDKAPKTVENFIGLATGKLRWKDPRSQQMMENKPLFDGTIFHRVIPNFMIQGGDPLGNGTGGPGYEFEDEFSPDLTFDVPGRLAMANSGPNTNGSQFFITEVPTPWLNGKHTIFGQCDDKSVELVKQIARVATDPRNNLPETPVKINHISISTEPTAKPAAKPGAKRPVRRRAGAKSTTTSTSAAKKPTATTPK